MLGPEELKLLARSRKSEMVTAPSRSRSPLSAWRRRRRSGNSRRAIVELAEGAESVRPSSGLDLALRRAARREDLAEARSGEWMEGAWPERSRGWRPGVGKWAVVAL